jgi:hypothetical protein
LPIPQEGFPTSQIEKIMLDYIREDVTSTIKGDFYLRLDTNLKVVRRAEQARDLGMLLTAILVGKQHGETVSVKPPADWWEAVKERFLPDLLKQHYPVKLKEQEIPVKVNRICPHLKSEPVNTHVYFCVAKEGPDKVSIDYDEYRAFLDWKEKELPLFERRKSYQWMETANGILIPVEHPTIMQRLVQFVRRNLLSPNAK